MSPTRVAAEPHPPSIAVLIPCYNEEAAVRQTVEAFRAALPHARVYVYDNASNLRIFYTTGSTRWSAAGATRWRAPISPIKG